MFLPRTLKSKPRQCKCRKFESFFNRTIVKNQRFFAANYLVYSVVCLAKSEGTKYMYSFHVIFLRNSVFGGEKLNGFGNRSVRGLNKSKNTASKIFTFIIFMVSSLIAGYNDLPRPHPPFLILSSRFQNKLQLISFPKVILSPASHYHNNYTD